MSPQRRSLVVGASGQVGHHIALALGAGRAICAVRKAATPDEFSMDLANLTEPSLELLRMVRESQLDAVYCAGAMTHVDRCESAPEEAMRVNSRGPAALAAAAAEGNLPFVFFSSDYVFDGKNGPYTEDAAPNPLSVYGRSKLAGESEVRKAHPGALIIRTTVVYGSDPARKNFLYSLRRACMEDKPFRAPVDQISTPTYNRDLAEAAIRLVRAGQSGVFNVSGPDQLTRYEFAKIAIRAMGLSDSNLEPVETAELHQPAPRPLNGGLLTEKLIRSLPDLRMRSAEEGVREWMAQDPPVLGN